ncbi:formate/nitrite transporter family protein [Paenibacillus antri]|uniref:Formate/nitrite transporter family protein n=1 Tax=Paenibacillus antri TaxID=2582848 RepID=A0A5R9GB70_9BACL|nr:formate/nitrite transporter family protein [Paenibacillus antri]TLS48655.1 formate/nitrite transporter family protein [Paenibacillus antri]
MEFRTPEQIAAVTIAKGAKKAAMPLQEKLILGFLAGAFIALGYLLSIRVTAGLPSEWSALSTLIGASVFPIGLILTLLGGGELLTGNMMALPVAALARRIRPSQVGWNWLAITAGNFLGAIFVAYVFGHVVGLTETGVFLEKTADVAAHKLEASFFAAFASGIGCNWLVALAVWLSYGARSDGAKLFVIWFPTMAFVAIGFQHVVANMFVIPAAIFAGTATWADFAANFVPVFLGNAAGGALFVATAYWHAYMHAGRGAAVFDTEPQPMEK